MKEQFVPYEIALKLKELGFNEACFTNWDMNGDSQLNVSLSLNVKNSYYSKDNGFNVKVCSAPLWQQAIDWLFQKLDLYYPYLEIRIFSYYSGYWYQSADGFLEEPELEIDFDNKEEMILEGIKLLEKCKK